MAFSKIAVKLLLPAVVAAALALSGCGGGGGAVSGGPGTPASHYREEPASTIPETLTTAVATAVKNEPDIEINRGQMGLTSLHFDTIETEVYRNSDDVSDAGGAPSFQLDEFGKFHGRSSSTRLFGWPLAMASRVALSQA